MNLDRRMAAEGLPSIPELAKTIVEEGAKLKSGGLNHEQITVTSAKIVIENTDCESYHGGFLYAGWKAELDGESILAHHRNWVKDGKLHTDGWAAYFLQKLTDAPIGAALIISKTLETTEHRVYTKTSYTEWTRTEEYVESYKNWEDQGLFLPEGIRAQVASIFNCHMTSTFHRAFDAATHYVNYGEHPKDKSA